jgi:hypothetical protein
MTSSARSAIGVQQTLAELLEANRSYLDWLDSIGAEEAKRDFLAQLERIATPTAGAYYYVPQAFLASTPLVQVGGVFLSPYTHRSTNLTSFSDPLNLIFTGNAHAERVADILMNEVFPPWLSTEIPLYSCADTQWTYVDNGVDRKWEPMSYTVAIGGCALHRCHMRLFDGGYDEQLGDFTVGNAHYEQSYLSKIHVVQDWDKSQDFVRRLIESTALCKQVREQRLQPAGQVVQNVPHDGIAYIIELT